MSLDAAKPPANTSYVEAFRSTTLLGGASTINLGFGMIRTKCLAIWLGPDGMGIFGAYTQISQVLTTLSGLGISTSGVRQIAAAAAAGDAGGVARTVTTQRRMAWGLGAGGALALALVAPAVSRWTFGTGAHTGALRLLALVVLCTVVSSTQLAVLQGFRRLKELTRAYLFAAVLATVVGIPVVWIRREDGIAPFMMTVAGVIVLVSWFYSRQVQVARVRLAWRETWTESRALFGLGAASMLSGLMAAAVGYLSRLIVLREIGLDAVGHYQAGAMLATYCVSFVLQGLGADFYPRLTAVAGDRRSMGRLLNEQMEVSLLLSGPLVVGSMALTPVLLLALYSAEFAPAVSLLRWLLLGTVMRVASWVLGFMLLAQNNAALFLATEAAGNALMLGLTWVLVRHAGLVGSGIAFFLGYLAYWVMMIMVARRQIAFRFTRGSRGVLAAVFLPTAVAGLCHAVVPRPWDGVLALALSVGMGFYALNALARRAPASAPARVWRRLRERLGC